MKIKPFAGVRPPKELASEVASRPYDVLNSEEAKAEAGEKSLLHIIKPEIDFDPIADEHEQRTYDKAVENFKKWQENGWLVQDEKEMYYIYAQTMDGRTIQNANLEPVFFAYPDVEEMNKIVENIVKNQKPEYDYIAPDGFGHTFWKIEDDAINARITEIFANVPAFYVADGHHRTAAAARVGAEKREQNPNHTGNEEYNYFLAVIFPESQLKVIDYNRVVKDLNGLSKEEFLSKLSESFDVAEMGSEIYHPTKLHNFSMYLDGKWYSLTAKAGTYNDNDPIGVLDVTVLSNLVFDKILNLGDLRTSKRIDFVGGIRGLGELKKRVDSGEMAVAFALYPVTMRQIIDIADTGNIMPPKTTWFEPKLRSGLVIHKLS